MNAYFLDSSSLVKRFAREVGTRWFINLFRLNPTITIYAARVTFVEVTSALARKAHSGQITIDSEVKSHRRLERLFGRRIIPVELNEQISLKAAGLARKHLLRGYDAIQLSAALTIAESRSRIGVSIPIFVCADNDLNKAAIIEGLQVENPNHHP